MIGFLRDLGLAFREKGLRALAGELPIAGSLVDIIADALKKRREREEKAEFREEIEQLARLNQEDAKRIAADVAREVANREPLEIQLQLENYLTQIPQALRQSLRRPEDPTGKSVPNCFDESPERLAQMLPQRLPRFRAGDKPDCLRGEWVLDTLLGSGGFGEVWKGRHADFDGTVAAFKFCLDPTAQDRLLKHEAALINQVMKNGNHPGIVPLQDANLRSDPPWLRYEYIPGGDLLVLFAELRLLPLGERLSKLLPVLLDLCETVGHFHRLTPAVVHHDLKPSNIMLMKTPKGWRVRLSDFGISQLTSQRALSQMNGSMPNLSMAKELIGAHTGLYASPQQRRGEPADLRDDVYSLGVIFYQLLMADPMAQRPGGLDWADELREGGVPENAVKLIGSCVADRIKSRPDSGAILAERLTQLSSSARSVPNESPTPDCNVIEGRVAEQSGKTNSKPPATFRNSLGIEFALIPKGSFWIGGRAGKCGNEQVTFAEPFYLGTYPVTQAQGQALMRCNPSHFHNGNQGGRNIQ